MPKGLIPLMLSSPDSTAGFGSRSSVIFPSGLSPIQPRSNRRASLSPPASPAHKRNYSDITPMIKLSRPPVRTSMKRQSQQVPASLPVLPYSSAEWKKAIAEVKRYHVTRRFRACSARCNEILTNVRDTVSTLCCAHPHFDRFHADFASSLWSSRHTSSTSTSMPQLHSRCVPGHLRLRQLTGLAFCSKRGLTTNARQSLSGRQKRPRSCHLDRVPQHRPCRACTRRPAPFLLAHGLPSVGS